MLWIHSLLMNQRKKKVEYVPQSSFDDAIASLMNADYVGWSGLDTVHKDETLQRGLQNAVDYLRGYYQREEKHIPESISIELGFVAVHFHNIRQEISPIMSYCAYWVDKIEWERIAIRSFLTDWILGPQPVAASFTINHTRSNSWSGDHGLAAEYSVRTMAESVEYVLDDLGL